MGRWWRWRRRPPPQPPKRDAPPPGPDPDEEAAARWVSTRDPALRAIVLEAGAVAPYEEYWWLGRIDPFRGRAYTNGHLITLALHDRLDEANPYAAAGAVPELLADMDPGVVAGARSFCARATGRALGRLWRLHWYLTGADAAALRALLLDNPAPVPDEALDEAWLSWVSTPDVRLWERLGRPARNGRAERWSRVALAVAAPEELCDAVLAGSTPDPVRECALAACRESGHVPADPARRAAFFLLTGQWQRYRELDGDGALLAEAYQDGTVRQRLRLRTAMAEARGVDLARVLASDAMRKTERDYLLRHLAARGEWERLWQVALVLPLPGAVTAARLIEDWVPAADEDRALFAALRAAKLARLRPERFARGPMASEVISLIKRPPHRLTAAERGWITVLGGHPWAPDDRAAIDLLRAWLDHRCPA
ncbi:MAG: hypothetical protein ACJ73S_21710 [Mycobacteriales bacterium]